MSHVVVSDSFDDLRAIHVRFLEEAARLGDLHVLLWSDEAVRSATGKDPKYAEDERLYILQAVRYVRDVRLVDGRPDCDALPDLTTTRPDIWVVDEKNDSAAKREFCKSRGLTYRLLGREELAGFPVPRVEPGDPSRKKVIVTGCYDWFHSGHVRFFEEVSELGELYVVVGHDENIRLLKGRGHPMFSQEERLYVVGSIRYVKQALISSGRGWLDAEPEIDLLRPDIYVVNEDGDNDEKREFCEQRGLQYVVLRRSPKQGLMRRTSTDLRGF